MATKVDEIRESNNPISDTELAVFAHKIVDQDKTKPFDDRQIPDLAQKILEKHRTGIVITGRVVNGKVEIDQTALDQIAKQFPGAGKSFIAVNAPFDPTTQLASENIG